MYRLVNLLSLDVAAGAMITSLLFAKQVMAPVRVYGIAALGVTVWIIYTADRLMDVKQLTQPAASERHRFHQQHDKALWLAVLIAVGAIGLLIVFIRPTVMLGGFVLAAVILFYLLFQRRLPLKEVAVATLYTMGVLLPAWPGQWDLLQPNIIIIGELFSIALTNLLLFAWFESEQDVWMGQSSLVTRIGKKTVANLIYILIAGGVILSVVHALFVDPVSWIFFGMWLMLVFIFYFNSYFKENERYRIFGDAIFYLPLLGLL